MTAFKITMTVTQESELSMEIENTIIETPNDVSNSLETENELINSDASQIIEEIIPNNESLVSTESTQNNSFSTPVKATKASPKNVKKSEERPKTPGSKGTRPKSPHAKVTSDQKRPSTPSGMTLQAPNNRNTSPNGERPQSSQGNYISPYSQKICKYCFRI